MNTLNQTSTWQYAVITVRNEPQRERLVIPYPNEKILRDLIAAARIVRNLCHHSFANAIRFVFSQNILSSTLRAFISF